MKAVQRPDVPAWFRIVKDYGFRAGPSVPFVLGGAVLRPLGEPPPSAPDAQAKLHHLLTLMATETPAGYGVHVSWCGDLDAYIFETHQPGDGLTWGPEFEAKNLDVLCARLWKEHRDEIAKGHYSKEKGGDWHEFRDDERARLRALLDSAR